MLIPSMWILLKSETAGFYPHFHHSPPDIGTTIEKAALNREKNGFFINPQRLL